VRSFFVIARNSSFTYKGKAVDVKQVGRELGVRYVLEGSVRKAGGRVRITCQLIEAESNHHVWADRFEGSLEDVFELQDEVTGSVVGAIMPAVEKAEIERARHRPTVRLNAYGFYLRGISMGCQLATEANNQALALFEKAVELDPNFASAYARAAELYVIRKANRWMIDRAWEVADAGRLARLALEHGRDDAQVLSLSGYALAYVTGDLNTGAASVDRALALNTNLAPAWGASGWIKACLGDSMTAIEHLGRAMRLSPLDPRQFVWLFGAALAHFVGGQLCQRNLLRGTCVARSTTSWRDAPHSLGKQRIGRAIRRCSKGDAQAPPARPWAAHLKSSGHTRTSAATGPGKVGEWSSKGRSARMTMRRLAAILAAEVVGLSRPFADPRTSVLLRCRARR
jgi:tetratricopeptide (TPR) repeat protein